jgi:hypothetical protein
METYTPKMSPNEMLERAEFVANAIRNGGKLLVSITHTSVSNMSYRYKVVLAYTDSKTNEVEFSNLTYWIAAEMKTKAVRAYAGDELRGSGCGFDRYHDAAYTVGFILKKYGLIETALDLATRNIYREI